MQSYSDKTADYFAHARKEITPLLPSQPGRVLEIGCGSGATLGWLRRDRRAIHTVGVEISEAAADTARVHAHEVYCLDFERVELEGRDCQFNLILCLDVLEHMVNPWHVIDRLVSQYLAPGGSLIVSLPNVRHHSVVLPLLFGGRWEYQDAGLLDRTHLRFFTRDTAIDLLTHRHLDSVHCIGSGFEWPSRKGVFNALTAGVFRELLTYQYLLTARKKDS